MKGFAAFRGAAAYVMPFIFFFIIFFRPQALFLPIQKPLVPQIVSIHDYRLENGQIIASIPKIDSFPKMIGDPDFYSPPITFLGIPIEFYNKDFCIQQHSTISLDDSKEQQIPFAERAIKIFFQSKKEFPVKISINQHACIPNNIEGEKPQYVDDGMINIDTGALTNMMIQNNSSNATVRIYVDIFQKPYYESSYSKIIFGILLTSLWWGWLLLFENIRKFVFGTH